MLDVSRFRARKRDPQFVTFINPSLAKGAALMARLALLARERLPETRFLVVESRGRWSESLQALGLTAADFPNVRVLPPQQDMRPVYGATRVLLAPSFWHESGGRVALEAMINGIPVVAPAHGGIKETLNGGGTIIDIPQHCRQQQASLVTELDALPWFEALQDLLIDDAHYDATSKRALEAAKAYDLSRARDRFVQLIGSL